MGNSVATTIPLPGTLSQTSDKIFYLTKDGINEVKNTANIIPIEVDDSYIKPMIAKPIIVNPKRGRPKKK
jgi:hypothetical protein